MNKTYGCRAPIAVQYCEDGGIHQWSGHVEVAHQYHQDGTMSRSMQSAILRHAMKWAKTLPTQDIDTIVSLQNGDKIGHIVFFDGEYLAIPYDL